MTKSFQHIAVLLNESIDKLSIKSDGIYIDCTFGAGGHSRAILSKLERNGHLYAIDRDPQSIVEAKKINNPRFTIIHGLFSNTAEYARRYNILGKVDGILLDLGVSSPQIDNAERGFSFMRDGPLDMRMDQTVGVSVSQWLLEADLDHIVWVIREFGEDRNAYRIAKAIIRHRNDKGKEPLTRTSQLARLVSKVTSSRGFRQKKHPATRVFRAFRMYINSEIEEIETILKNAISILVPGGRLLVISFHSLEDRIVKSFIRKESQGPEIPSGIPLTETQINKLGSANIKVIGKAVKPSKHEIGVNVRSRSSVLRVVQKL
ncbi:ribosomal RNA small subunit methyltransferase H [Candidatus Photodesmus blepharus]|uniref:Ribosomal RNA small subunit methyltransferase H n=1 Tax=Candidatus Photodesmus blepharonis TaxID=1179155 RepID=A0A084CMU0_9GAMM|nr:16S rRNA (cytosine(1402)-N(4))-methyltransferase RsmH [Candidatus Photodesmus blepharus]KEY91119.1 ribosomal RNA small subunit methyltransferase H [Candidatus Photodesmus blepharus]